MKKTHIIALSVIVAIVAGMSIGVAQVEATPDTYTEKVYSPTILNALSEVIADTSPRKYTYGDHTTIEIRTTINTVNNSHAITYQTYVNGTLDNDLTTHVDVVVINDNLYEVVTPDFSGFITDGYTQDVTRSVTLGSSVSCAATPDIHGHGFKSEPVEGCGFNWESTGSIEITSSNGKLLWSTPASVHIWGVQYAYDEVRLNPHFATSNAYYSNSLGGSLTFLGVYSANDSYYGRATFYYQN
ncbi:MAG: hypothetical protein F4X71_01435 [Cenarchaeum sp. SB0662_bin_33]|nr:hypothetical protein [Cenarchaeum sp. SB0662_bin_33]